ncbi:Lrp/AsnC family transcriptional regulator [Nonomuraea sp. NPDC052116]|uniref:Lrp/AsnC family transcriptional regulator n=1 Tax=Nonomuraea sp. NPDC052116 TaxID=3155665 RepID=UPI003436EFEA
MDATERRIAAVLMASPRASWRTIARVLGISERTVVRRATPLLHDGTLRPTAIRNPARFPRLIPMVLRIRCRPSRIQAIAAGLARRADTVWVDILGGGDEISSVLFLDGPRARTSLLLRDLPATAAVHSWDAYDLLKVFPAGFAWSAGLLPMDQFETLATLPREPADAPQIQPLDDALIDQLAANARAGYSDLATRLGTSASTVRRRLDLLISAHMVRMACEVDLRLLGIGSEALLWIATGPGSLEATGQELSRHPQVRFTAATTGAANLLVAVAADDLGGLYSFLTETVGSLDDVRRLEVTPILSSPKRTGLLRRSEI